MNRLVDSLLEEIGDQLESLGLDPLPIPDIRIPYSLDTVSVFYNVYTCLPDKSTPQLELHWSNFKLSSPRTKRAGWTIEGPAR